MHSEDRRRTEEEPPVACGGAHLCRTVLACGCESDLAHGFALLRPELVLEGVDGTVLPSDGTDVLPDSGLVVLGTDSTATVVT